MSDGQQTDEKILMKIVKRNSTCVQENDFLNLILYYNPQRH